MKPVEILENALIPLFSEAAARIAQEYPSYRLRVDSFPSGRATSYQGHNINLECVFPDALSHEADCVTVIAGVKFLTTTPMFSELYVDWCTGDHPDVSIDLMEQAVPFSPESLRDVVAQIPELIAVFEKALRAWVSRRSIS